MWQLMVKVSLDVDSPVHRINDDVKVVVNASNDEGREVLFRFKLEYFLNDVAKKSSEYSIVLLPGEAQVIEDEVKLDEEGLWVIKLSGGFDETSVSKSIKVKVADFKEPVRLALVYHMHQPPWYMSDGRYYAEWAFAYIYEPVMAPFFNGGPYLFHAVLNDKYRGVKVNIHLSPSLLRQWIDAIERGYTTVNGARYDRGSDVVKLVEKTLEMYRRQINEGQVEPLTSIYAHTIAGYLISRYSMLDIVDEELSIGMSVTEEALKVKPTGAWTPEMAWDMQLIDVYRKNGIKYTVLCGRNHFPGSQGDKGTIYEPYSLEDSLTVFFRDERLSNLLSFQNVFPNEENALKFAAMLARSITDASGLVTIALDGENFIAMSKTPALVGFMLDKFYSYISRMQDLKIIETVKLGQLAEGRYRRLTFIPTTTWLGGFTKWDGERREHRDYWVRVVDAYNVVKAVESSIGERLSDARYALWHALDSDFWWADFWTPDLINHWLSNVNSSILGKVKLAISPTTDKYEGFLNRPMNIEVRAVNESGFNIRARLTCMEHSMDVNIPSGESKLTCSIVPRLAGTYRVPVVVSLGDWAFTSTYITLNIHY